MMLRPCVMMLEDKTLTEFLFRQTVAPKTSNFSFICLVSSFYGTLLTNLASDIPIAWGKLSPVYPLSMM